MIERNQARTKRQSVPAGAVEVLIAALEDIGGNVDAALTSAGLTPAYPAILEGVVTDVPRHAFARLSQDCILAFHYYISRRDAVRPFPVSHFRLLCLSLLACPTLRIAMATLEDFQRITLNSRHEIPPVQRKDAVRIGLQSGGSRHIADMLVAMYGLAAFHRLFGWLTGEDIPLTRVMLNFPKAMEKPVINELLQFAPEFDQAWTAIEFSASHLDRPIVRKYAELSELFTQFPFDLFPPENGAQSLVDRIRGAMESALSRKECPPDIPRLAKMFGLSIATFRRRVAAENGSVAAIRKDCRLRLGMQLLAETRLTVKEVAYRLHFSDDAAFRRAFRSWMGLSPAEFRLRHRAR